MDEYEINREKVFDGIPEKTLVALATSDGGIVTSRTMSAILMEYDFYFQTDGNSVKAVQLGNNKNAAISFDNYEIIGFCENLGRPVDSGNEEFMKRFTEAFPKAAKKYSELEQEVLFRFIPTKIKMWVYEEDGAVIKELDILANKYTEDKLGY